METCGKGFSALGVLLCLFACQTPLHADVIYTPKVLYSIPNPYYPSGLFQSVFDFQGQIVGAGTSQAVAYDASGSPISLSSQSSGYYATGALATDGQSQVGDGILVYNGPGHALLWQGSSTSVVDLHPSNMTSSVAYSVSGAYQAGRALDANGNSHAILWNGTAASAIDLTPGGATNAVAYGVGGGQEVGFGTGGTLPSYYSALLWTGSAGSVINLNPAGEFGSVAYATDGSQQVGYVLAGNYHAYLWSGTAASAVDLHPAGYELSIAYGVGNGLQVGYAVNPSIEYNDMAMVWSGSAASAVNLGVLLPSNFADSYALSTDASGDVYGFSYDSNASAFDSIEWVASNVPEPTSISIVLIAAVSLLVRRR